MRSLIGKYVYKTVTSICGIIMALCVAILPTIDAFAAEYNGAVPRILVNGCYALFSFHNDEWADVIDNENGYCDRVEDVMGYVQGDFIEYAKLIKYAAYVNVPAYKLGMQGGDGVWTFASSNSNDGLDSFLNQYMKGEVNEKQLKELKKSYPFIAVIEYTNENTLDVKRVWCEDGNEETYAMDMEMYANESNGPLEGLYIGEDVVFSSPRDMYYIFAIPANVGIYPKLDFDMNTGKNVKKYIPDYSGANRKRTPTLSETGVVIEPESSPTTITSELSDVSGVSDVAPPEQSIDNQANVEVVESTEAVVDYSNSNALLRILVVVLILMLVLALVVIVLLLTKKKTKESE